MDAIAVLRLSRNVLPEHVPPAMVTDLEDGILLATGVGFDAEPDEIAVALRRMLGSALDVHEDARGVFVFPDVVEPEARKYDDVIAEMGEGGMWCPIARPEAVLEADEGEEQAFGDLGAAMNELLGAIPPGFTEEMQRSMASGETPDLATLAARLEAALGGPEQMQALASQMMRALNVPPPGAPDVAVADTADGEADADMEALAARARELAKQMHPESPEELARIEAELRERLAAARKPTGEN